VAWLALLAAAAVAQEGIGDSRDELRRTFLAALNEARGKQGLPPVRLSAALSRAAQAQVDDMAARRYYDLKSPDGRTIESWLRDAGYREQLVTEKLVRTDRSPRALAASWGVSPEAHRASLFHPEVEEVGVGAVEYQGLPLYAFVLARSEESYLPSAGGSARASSRARSRPRRRSRRCSAARTIARTSWGAGSRSSGSGSGSPSSARRAASSWSGCSA
jgi:hypothetical protein